MTDKNLTRSARAGWAVRARRLGCLGLSLLCLARAWSAEDGSRLAAGEPEVSERGGLGREGEAVRGLLGQYCLGCHGERRRGGLDLRDDDGVDGVVAVRRARSVWEAVLKNVRGGTMPPEGRPQPTLAERERMAGWLERVLYDCDRSAPDPGRVTLRRLNRTEYNNTIRDLVGIDFQPGEDFPADDVGYGFDNIGDVLSLSPILLEKYLRAAERILERGIVVVAIEAAGSERAGGLVVSVPREPTVEARYAAARALVERFARRAFRRPVEAEEVTRLLTLYAAAAADGQSYVEAVKVSLLAVLVSPHFLFRGEFQPEPDNPVAVHPVSEIALASRLSYFLWSTMPDEELLGLAERGQLRAELDGQVRRMLADPRSRALVESFAGQWLQLRKLDEMRPDPEVYPGFDEELRWAMRRETELFFERILREDRSVLEFIEADWTYANARLGRHYGWAQVVGEEFVLVDLADSRRGGVLTQGSILTLTSNPTRTSPVKRGKWVLENVLGTPPPPPPPNVPELEETSAAQLRGTLRQRLEQHRADPLCASCHARMDPIGFAFENFDGVGAWRERDGEYAIDPAGRLASGEGFQGPAELRRLLVEAKRREFLRCLSAKLLTYALGRGLEPSDQCALDDLEQDLVRGEYRFSALVRGVVGSVPFQQRRGDGAALAGGS